MRKKPTAATIPMIRRMQQLRRAGLSVGAVRAVVALDFGDAPCVETVRKYTSAWSPLAQEFSGVGHAGSVGLTNGPNKDRVA